jgi:phytoene dehydrogenase-like protein
VNGVAVVLGGGADELVAAHLLARAGHRVVVLNAQSAAATSMEAAWVPPAVIRDLALDRQGLLVQAADPWAEAPLPDGGRLQLFHDMGRSVESIRRVSARDAGKWPEFCERTARLARLLEGIYSAAPPDPMSGAWKDLAHLGGLARRARGLGRRGLEDLLRLPPMPAADFLDDWFENDALKGLLGAQAVMHLCHGPRSGGTAFSLLHRHLGSPRGVFRPPLTNVRRVLEQRPGIEVRHGVEVARLIVRDGAVAGVALAGGEDIATPLVVSGLGPQRTLLSLLDPGWLDPALARAVENVRARGVMARMSLSAETAPGFSSLVIAPSLDYVERAYDDAKYRRISQSPFIVADAAPPDRANQHRIDVHIQYAPYALEEGEWDAAQRQSLGRRAFELLSRHVPALSNAGIERVQSPPDLEQEHGWPEGQAHHAELALDQLLWMRPVPQLARYRTPIRGLYLCGPSMHPGGGIAGAAGRNCARAILAS